MFIDIVNHNIYHRYVGVSTPKNTKETWCILTGINLSTYKNLIMAYETLRRHWLIYVHVLPWKHKNSSNHRKKINRKIFKLALVTADQSCINENCWPNIEFSLKIMDTNLIFNCFLKHFFKAEIWIILNVFCDQITNTTSTKYIYFSISPPICWNNLLTDDEESWSKRNVFLRKGVENTIDWTWV